VQADNKLGEYPDGRLVNAFQASVSRWTPHPSAVLRVFRSPGALGRFVADAAVVTAVVQ
jgi:hypothetical protein